MERTRVPKGKKYWYLDDRLFVLECIETGSPIDDARAEVGNYFHSPHKLSDMSFKIEKVLKGADVIEMPSKNEIIAESIEKIPCWCKDGDPHQWVDCDICSTPDKRECFIEGVNWLKSKIIK